MTGSEPGQDHCPYCGIAFDIVSVKFRFGRTSILSACPNCALVLAEEGRSLRSIAKSEKFVAIVPRPLHSVRTAVHAHAMRLRTVLAILLLAVITAAALRHSIHVYGGLSREDIRGYTLLAILCVAAAVIVFRRRSAKPKHSARGQIPLGKEARQATSNSASKPKRPDES